MKRVKPTSRFSKKAPIKSTSDQVESMKVELEIMKEKTVEMEVQMKGMEAERDFYFSKLRDIEILLQNLPKEEEDTVAARLSKNLFKILYATEDDTLDIDEIEKDVLNKAADSASSELERTTEAVLPEEELKQEN